MIKLIATDMDGTLLTTDKKLPPDFPQVLEQLHQRGIRFMAASGRSYVTLRENFAPWADSMDFICDNGAFLVEQGKMVFLDSFSPENLRELIRCCLSIPHTKVLLCGVHGTYYLPADREFQVQIQQHYVNSCIVSDLEAVEDAIFKIAICDLKGPASNSLPLLEQAFGDRFCLPISGPVWMDIVNKGVNKGAALQRLQKQWGISPEETMVFGDYFNDIELLQQAAYSFITANAAPEMGQYARYRTKSNDEFGVTYAIRQYLLEQPAKPL